MQAESEPAGLAKPFVRTEQWFDPDMKPTEKFLTPGEISLILLERKGGKNGSVSKHSDFQDCSRLRLFFILCKDINVWTRTDFKSLVGCACAEVRKGNTHLNRTRAF